MPSYDYRCRDCGKLTTLYFADYTAYDNACPSCADCDSQNLVQVIGKVIIAQSEDSRIDALSDPAMLGDLDESDPKSMGKWMRRMSQELGEDMGSEFNEVVGRLESGEDPESIEKSMPDLDADLT